MIIAETIQICWHYEVYTDSNVTCKGQRSNINMYEKMYFKNYFGREFVP